jgi:hypothetical protein
MVNGSMLQMEEITLLQKKQNKIFPVKYHKRQNLNMKQLIKNNV